MDVKKQRIPPLLLMAASQLWRRQPKGKANTEGQNQENHKEMEQELHLNYT